MFAPLPLMHPLLITLFTSVLISGCATTKTPQRAIYNGVDAIDTVDPQQLVGVWDVTPLNPLDGQLSQSTRIHYKADGSLVGRLEWKDDERAEFGDMTFGVFGTWRIEAGAVVHDDIRMLERSGSEIGDLISSVINNSERNLAGSADIQQLSATRVIMLGTDGAAMQYDRVR